MEKIISDLMLGFFFFKLQSQMCFILGVRMGLETNERYGQAMNKMFLKNLCWSKNFIHNIIHFSSVAAVCIRIMSCPPLGQ